MRQLVAKAAEHPSQNRNRHHHRGLPGRQRRHRGHNRAPLSYDSAPLDSSSGRVDHPAEGAVMDVASWLRSLGPRSV